jgi:hypothetical protein
VMIRFVIGTADVMIGVGLFYAGEEPEKFKDQLSQNIPTGTLHRCWEVLIRKQRTSISKIIYHFFECDP